MAEETTLQEANPESPKNDFNVVIGDFVTKIDLELIFSGENVNKMPENTTFPALMRLCGAFKSNNDARRNGWDKEIPEGFSEWTVGKKRIRLTIFKKTKQEEDYEGL